MKNFEEKLKNKGDHFYKKVGLTFVCILFLFLGHFVSSIIDLSFFQSAKAAGVTANWIGPNNGSWNTASYWDIGQVPTSTTIVNISSSTAMTVNVLTGQVIEFDTLNLGGGAATTTLVLTGNILSGVDLNINAKGILQQANVVQQVIAGNLTIASGGVLTHSDNSTAQSYIVSFLTNNITVDAGGSINVDAKGYDGAAGANGYGTGGGEGINTTNYGGGGGGHFGDGGYGRPNGLSGISMLGGISYGDITNPTTIGSGGGGSYINVVGGAGGGLVVLNASSTITINGTITADGGAGGITSTNGAGGGSGGAVKIVANSVAGTPQSFTVVGGAGGNESGVDGGGGGGGGVLIQYTTSNSINSSAINMAGGTGNDAAQYGGAGVVLVKDTDGISILSSTNAGTSGAQSTQAVSALTVDYFTITSSSIYTVTSTKSLTINQNSPSINVGASLGSLKVSGGTINFPTSLNLASTTLDYWSTSVWSYVTSTDLTLSGGGTLNLSYFSTSTALNLNTLTIDSGGNVTHSDNSTAQTHVVNINTNVLNISSGGSINVDGKGYDGGYRNGRTVTGTIGYGPGGGQAGEVRGDGGAGGGHFGDGGIGDDIGSDTIAAGGIGYGDITNPSTIGSGGGGSFDTAYGGSGGGLIILHVTSTITINGNISADGSIGSVSGSPDTSSGGGSGGAVKIVADTIAGTPESFTVTGGASGNVTSYPYGDGGGGGGGGVLIQYTTSNSIGVSSVNMAGATGNDAGQYGGAGVVLIKDTDGTTTLFSVNAGTSGAQSTQGVSSLTVDYFTIASSSIYTVTSTKSLIINQSSPSINVGSSLGTLRISGGNITTPNTLSLTNLTLDYWYGSNWTNFITLNLTLGSSTTLNQSYFSTSTSPFRIRSLTIGSGGTLTHTDNTLANATHMVNMRFRNLDIQSGGSINVDAKGYDGGYNNNATTGPGYGPGGGWYGGNINVAGGGGAQFGNGGVGYTTVTSGIAYGDITNRTTFDFGSGGGGSYGPRQGGSGGGFIKLRVDRDFTYNGTISAIGGAGGTCGTSQSCGGGGGGGMVEMECSTVTGTPQSLTVAGGAGGKNSSNASRGGGGGGGGVYLGYYTSSNIVSSSAYFSYVGGTGYATGSIGAFYTAMITSPNAVPSVTAISPNQNTTNTVTVSTTITETDSEVTTLFVEYSLDGSTWVSSTIGSVTASTGSVSTSTGSIFNIGTDTTSSISLTFDWDIITDLPDTENSTVYLRVIPYDDLDQGSAATSSAFSVDTKTPTVPGVLVPSSVSTSTVILGFGTSTIEGNFAGYKIFANSVAAATSSTDPNLAVINFNGATSTVLTGLSPNTSYTVYIAAYDNIGHFSTSTEATFVTLTPIPTGFGVNSYGNTSVELQVDSFLNHSVGLSGYYFDLFDLSNVLLASSSLQSGVRTWTTSVELTPNTQYNATVYYSNINGVTSTPVTLSFTTLSSEISAVSTTVNSDTAITVNWAGDGYEYKVRSATNTTDCASVVDYVEYNWVSSTPTNYQVTSLSPNTAYCFQEKSKNAEGAETSWAPVTPVGASTKPSVPANVTVSVLSDSSALVSWEGNGNYYQVENVTDSSSTAWLSSTSTTFTGLSANTSYSFRVKAKNISESETDWSSPVSGVTFSSGPVSVLATPNSTSQITVSWTGSGEEYYIENITASTTSGWVSGTNYSFANLLTGTSYSFKVKARNSAGVDRGEWSSTVTSTTNSIEIPPGTGGGDDEEPIECNEAKINSFTDSTGNIKGANEFVIITNHCRQVKMDISLPDGVYEAEVKMNFWPFGTDSGELNNFYNLKRIGTSFFIETLSGGVAGTNDFFPFRVEKSSIGNLDYFKKDSNSCFYNSSYGTQSILSSSGVVIGVNSIGFSEDNLFFSILNFKRGLTTILRDSLGGYYVGENYKDMFLFQPRELFLKISYKDGDELKDSESFYTKLSYQTFGQYCLENPSDTGCNKDIDFDYIKDKNDNCPCVKNTDQKDTDKDGIGDVCDFVFERNDYDMDKIKDRPESETALVDNCREVPNFDQKDTDKDGIGDACDPKNNLEGDDDSDGILNGNDNCINNFNPDQADSDKDGVGDVCDNCPYDKDNDIDGDLFCVGNAGYVFQYKSNDNCPLVSNIYQTDKDKDGIGDACDELYNPDADKDGIEDSKDNCKLTPNSNQLNSDGDSKGDACDQCPFDSTNTLDELGQCKVDEEDDNDKDGIKNDKDNCINVYNPDQADADRDGVGDVCDLTCKVGTSCTINSCQGKFDSNCSCVDTPNDNCPCVGEDCEIIEPPVCIGDNCPCVGEDCPKPPPCEGPNCKDDDGEGNGVIDDIIDGIKNIFPDLPENIVKFISEQFDNVSEAAKYIANIVNDFKANPVVQSLNKNVAVPVMAAAGVGNMAVAVATTSAMGFAQIANFLRYVFTQPFLLLRIRKRKTWGTIYNAFTKQPVDLAVIRLVDATTNKIIRSQVTDIKGRYLLVADEGTYRLEVSRNGFSGFSEYLQNAKEDTSFGNLYHGKEFTLKEHSFINYNIPMDPENRAASTVQILKEHSKKTIQNLFSLLGLIVSGISLFITPSTTVTLFFFMHLLFYSTFYHFAHVALPAAWGMIVDKLNNSPLSRVVVRVFDSTYNKLVETGITDSKGRYAVLVGPSTYYVTYDKQVTKQRNHQS